LYKEYIQQLKPLCSKSNIPKLSFCGYEASHPLRTQYLDFFEKSKLVECHFVRREQFWNGCIGDKKSKEEFEQNLLLSEFVFCPRGTGNFSIRFCETLKAGRIPVVPIDDDTVWPLSKYINWKNFVVSGSSPNILVEKIIQFWEVNNIEDKQKECSDLFEKYLKTESILPYLFLEFQEKIFL
jgi:hypothetical protein